MPNVVPSSMPNVVPTLVPNLALDWNLRNFTNIKIVAENSG